MKTEKNHFATGIYTILFGLLGLNDYYRAKYLRGCFRAIAFIVSICYFCIWQAPLRISLSHYELIDNLYTPAYTNANAAILFAHDIIASALLIICIAFWIYDLYRFFFKYDKKEYQHVSKKRYVVTALLLGWSGLHDYLVERAKYANTHIILLILSISLVAISSITESSAAASIMLITSAAILFANELIAIIEAFNFIGTKHEKRSKAEK